MNCEPRSRRINAVTDVEAIDIAKRYGLPIVRIPPAGCIDEVITVDFQDAARPVVTREPSSNFGPHTAGKLGT
jgi:hypothetical protein